MTRQSRVGPSVFWKGRAVMYRLYEGDRLIYVGATVNLPRRIQEHKRAWWFQLVTKTRIQVFPDIAAARAAESVAIQEEEPIANVVGTGRQASDTSWPRWTKRDHAMAEEFRTRWMREERKPA